MLKMKIPKLYNFYLNGWNFEICHPELVVMSEAGEESKAVEASVPYIFVNYVDTYSASAIAACLR